MLHLCRQVNVTFKIGSPEGTALDDFRWDGHLLAVCWDVNSTSRYTSPVHVAHMYRGLMTYP